MSKIAVLASSPDAPLFLLEPALLQAIGGLIVGYVVTRTVFFRRLAPKVFLLLTVLFVIIVCRRGVYGLEQTMVARLTEFFASSNFALGILIGAVVALPNRHLRDQ